MFKDFLLITLRALWLFLALPLLLAVLHVLIGALCGWSIGLVLGDTILGILSKIGIANCSMWEIGVFIGFISSFFRNFITLNKFPIKHQILPFIAATAPLFFVILSVIVGIISGWFVGLFFEDSIQNVLYQLGITGCSMWEIGAFTGFITGFFRNVIKFKNTKSV